MREVNRSLIVVKPKQLFLDWIKSVEPQDDITLDSLHDDASAYLIPEWLDFDDRPQIVSWCSEYVFEIELWSWYTDETLWPKTRDSETFSSWFEVEFHSLVLDLDHEEPLEHVDYDSDLDDDIVIDPNSNGH